MATKPDVEAVPADQVADSACGAPPSQSGCDTVYTDVSGGASPDWCCIGCDGTDTSKAVGVCT